MASRNIKRKRPEDTTEVTEVSVDCVGGVSDLYLILVIGEDEVTLMKANRKAQRPSMER